MFIPDDTICALSSTAVPAARAIIRLSGPKALAIADTFFQSDTPDTMVTGSPFWRVLKGQWPLEDTVTVPVKIYIFPAPRSYTTEDMAEVHLPGSLPLTQMVLAQLQAHGARMAQAGEFTARAFFNGRIDLTEAEAVAQIINARSDEQLRAASRLLEGKLCNQCKTITEQIAELLALIEADIDFSEEDIEFASVADMTQQLKLCITELDRLLQDALSWDQLNHLPQVVIAGLANAGKSTLANALLQTDRAITSAIAGTTRDLVTAPLKLNQGECLLVDTAGLGDVEDVLAEQTQRLARQTARTCDLLVYVLDISRDHFDQELDLFQQLSGCPRQCVAANKMDLCETEVATRIEKLKKYFDCPILAVSAGKERNLDELRQTIEEQLQLNPGSTADEAIALTSRQKQALTHGRESLCQAQNLLDESHDVQPEFLALHLREALDHLGTVSGKVVPNDILTIIFSKFCIGK